MGRACGTYADVNERRWWGNLKERDHTLGTLGLGWEDNIRMYLKIELLGWSHLLHCEYGNETGFHTMRAVAD